MSAVACRSFGRTETGKVRRHNEDSILVREEAGLWVVADGLGGHSAGDLASQLIVRRLAQLPRGDDICDFIDAIEDTLVDVNAELIAVAAERGQDLIGSTVVILVHGADFTVCGWVGDSRGYCFDESRLRQVTEDHVHGVKDDVTQFGQSGSPSEPPPGALTRAIGAQECLFVDWVVSGVRDGQTFVLCSDGLNKEVADEEIDLECGRARDPRSLVDRLCGMALSRSARDNISVVAVQLKE